LGCLIFGAMRRSAANLSVGMLGLVAVGYAGFRTLWMVRAPTKVYAYLPYLPLFVAWRTYISVKSLLQGVSKGWVRTERRGDKLD
jgi:hypothetical protein